MHISIPVQGRIQDFKVGVGRTLKKFCRAEGGAKIFGVFRLKNHDFTPKKNHIFTNFRGGGGPAPPLETALTVYLYIYSTYTKINPKAGVKHQSIN